MARYSGKNGKMQVDGANIPISEWDFEESISLPDASDSDTGDGTTRVSGRKDGQGTFKGFVDDTNLPYTTLRAGSEVVLKLYTNATQFFSVPAILERFKTMTPIRTGDPVSFEGSFKLNGTVTLPT